MSIETTDRVLRLLALLAGRSEWGGAELARRLQITQRTVRRDVDRLRTLGYRIDATAGRGGGYRLAPGPAVPPLFLDDDEATAIAGALLTAASASSAGMADSAARALAKLHHVLPAPAARRVDAVRSVAHAVTLDPAPITDPAVVAALAEALRDDVGVRFEYRTRGGNGSTRRVEPHTLTTVQRVWYVVGYDLDRNDWRLFRADRMTDVVRTGHQRRERTPPGGASEFIARSLAGTNYRHPVDVVVAGTVAQARRALPWLNEHRITAAGGTTSIHLGGDTVDVAVRELVRVLGSTQPVSVTTTPAVRAHLHRLGERLAAIS